jgi:hypothetical protein
MFRTRRVFQQGGLADARLALEHERPATATRGLADQLVQAGRFRSAPEQHAQ